jgi:thioredoxin 1
MTSNKIINITSITDFNTLISNNKVVILKASASWCGPCKRINPFFIKCIDELPPNICIAVIDIDESPGVKRAYKIKSVPYFASFINGDITDILSSSNMDEIKSFFIKTIKNNKKQ